MVTVIRRGVKRSMSEPAPSHVFQVFSLALKQSDYILEVNVQTMEIDSLVQTPVLPLTSCANSCKLHNLFVPLHPHLLSGNNDKTFPIEIL